MKKSCRQSADTFPAGRAVDVLYLSLRLLMLPPTACAGWQWMSYISGQWSRLRTDWMIGPRDLWSVTQSPAGAKLSVMYPRRWYQGKCSPLSSLMAWMLGQCTPSKFTDGTKQRGVPHIPHGCVCIQRDAAPLQIWAEWDFKVQHGELQNPASGAALQRSSLVYRLATICVPVMHCHGKGGRQLRWAVLGRMLPAGWRRCSLVSTGEAACGVSSSGLPSRGKRYCRELSAEVMSGIKDLELSVDKERLRGLGLLAWKREGSGVILLMQWGNKGRDKCFSVLFPSPTWHWCGTN